MAAPAAPMPPPMLVMRYAGVVILNMQHACMLKDRCAAVHEWNSRHSCRGHQYKAGHIQIYYINSFISCTVHVAKNDHPYIILLNTPV